MTNITVLAYYPYKYTCDNSILLDILPNKIIINIRKHREILIFVRFASKII